MVPNLKDPIQTLVYADWLEEQGLSTQAAMFRAIAAPAAKYEKWLLGGPYHDLTRFATLSQMKAPSLGGTKAEDSRKHLKTQASSAHDPKGRWTNGHFICRMTPRERGVARRNLGRFDGVKPVNIDNVPDTYHPDSLAFMQFSYDTRYRKDNDDAPRQWVAYLQAGKEYIRLRADYFGFLLRRYPTATWHLSTNYLMAVVVLEDEVVAILMGCIK